MTIRPSGCVLRNLSPWQGQREASRGECALFVPRVKYFVNERQVGTLLVTGGPLCRKLLRSCGSIVKPKKLLIFTFHFSRTRKSPVCIVTAKRVLALKAA